MKKTLIIVGIIAIIGIAIFAYMNYYSYRDAKQVIAEMSYDSCISNPKTNPEFCKKSSECVGKKMALIALKEGMSIREALNDDRRLSVVTTCSHKSMDLL